MTEQQYPEPTVGALVFDPEGKALLVKSNKWRDKYCIPGGHIELGETMSDALRREIREETGLDIHDIEFAQMQEFIFDEAFHEKKHFIFLDFVCKTRSSEVVLNSESQEYTWVTLGEALRLPLEPYTRRLIEHVKSRMIQTNQIGGPGMSKTEQAVSCFRQGFSCSQAVLLAFGPELGLEQELALRVAGGFGGGMGRLAGTCGAVTGAFMVLGLRYGMTDAKNTEPREKTYRLVRELAEQFEARNGSILCRELLGCDIGTPEGRKQAQDQGLSATLCPKLVQDAAEIVEQMLED